MATSIDFSSPGRMISSSKTCPKGHTCVFNANVLTRSAGKIWFGDLDLTADAAELTRLARERGEDVYVLKEKDARFATEAAPAWEKAVALFYANGMVEFCEDFL
jgi:hypothetical protein